MITSGLSSLDNITAFYCRLFFYWLAGKQVAGCPVASQKPGVVCIVCFASNVEKRPIRIQNAFENNSVAKRRAVVIETKEYNY